eukprot:sb/3468988/
MQCFEELTDLEEDCPVCVQENKQTLEHIRSLEHIENLDQQFFRSVEHAPDPFTAVADFFAKGVYTGNYTRSDCTVPSQTRIKRPQIPKERDLVVLPDSPPQQLPIAGSVPAKSFVPTKLAKSSSFSRSSTLPVAKPSEPVAFNPFDSTEDDAPSGGGNPFDDTPSPPPTTNPFPATTTSTNPFPAKTSTNPFPAKTSTNPFPAKTSTNPFPDEDLNPFAEEGGAGLNPFDDSGDTNPFPDDD